MPTMLIDSAPDFIREVDADDEPTEFTYCGLVSCGPGTECHDCLRAQGFGCVHSEVHAPGTEPYAVGRDSEGEPSCEACLSNEQEGCVMDEKEQKKRDVREVLTEYLAAKARVGEYQKLRAELMDLIGEDHSHDPRNCIACSALTQARPYQGNLR